MHHFARPVAVVVWQLTPLANATAAAPVLQGQLAAEPGVSACAVSPRTNCVALVYHPEHTTPEALYRAVGRYGGHVVSNPPAPAAQPGLRQCPVPAGYVALLDQLRFALSVRRFFPSV